MHELAITTSLLEIIRDEMQKHGASRLVLARVRHGAMANIVPEAMHMAFETLIAGSELSSARLELVEEPLVLACGGCHMEFTPESATSFELCPHCRHPFNHEVISGKELYLDHLEVE